ncbi:metallophosphoesterase [Bacillus sp. RAR_GA_16]|uniref:metallophosphoesterase n=1 Tax=Bacillus sp. RAR_GA_16 TaxID=2876774 RepID=UPI001CCF3FEC|nr:metallophosphoesterase [Bacillus sp. RAR_GA_16]MCA0171349.1 metallophosphoesterase [Bacillus sp. RAR_GA_16]
MTKKRRKTILFALLILIFSVVYYFLQLNWISVTKETVHLDDLPEEFNGYKVVQLSDLHNKEFGDGNKRLVNKIHEIKPDTIVITGDMLTNTREVPNNGNVLITFLENLNNDYPIYYITGEHEEGLYYEERNKYQKEGTKEVYEEKLSNMGVTVLNDEQITITRQNAEINLYGLREHLSGEIQIEERLGKTSENEVDILLSHRPFYFDEYVNWGADLVFSGDTHGGMVRLPFIGGNRIHRRFFSSI